MCRIIAFAVFWTAAGMLFMLFFRYRIMGALVALVLLAASYCILMLDDK